MFFNTTDLKNQEIYLHLYKTADENIEKGYVPAYYFKIMNCGAELVGIIDVPEWHDLCKSGQRKTCQYIVGLDK